MDVLLPLLQTVLESSFPLIPGDVEDAVKLMQQEKSKCDQSTSKIVAQSKKGVENCFAFSEVMPKGISSSLLSF